MKKRDNSSERKAKAKPKTIPNLIGLHIRPLVAGKLSEKDSDVVKFVAITNAVIDDMPIENKKYFPTL